MNVCTENWRDISVNWDYFDVIILKSPWDYHQNYSEFLSWLEKIKKLKIPLLNSFETIINNADKNDFKMIENEGFGIIPSKFIDKNSFFTNFDYFFDYFDSEKLILKPCVSSDARNTIILNKHEINTQINSINNYVKNEDFIVQKFLSEIENGELSLLFFNEKYSHSVLKKPKKGDFRVQLRVQHVHGGSIDAIIPENEIIENAQKIVNRFAKNTLYARVDGVITNNQFLLIELELIEPFLYLENIEKEPKIEAYFINL